MMGDQERESKVCGTKCERYARELLFYFESSQAEVGAEGTPTARIAQTITRARSQVNSYRNDDMTAAVS